MVTANSFFRYRQKGTRSTQLDTTQYVQNNNCSDTAYRVYSGPYTCGWPKGESKTMKDMVTPGWRDVMKRQFLVGVMESLTTKSDVVGTSTYQVTTVASSCTSPVLKRTWTEIGCPFTLGLKNAKGIDFLSQPPSNPFDESKLIDEVFTKTMAGRAQGEANLIESLAEMDQVWHMVRSPLEAASKFLDAFVNRRFKGSQRLYKKVYKRGRAFLVFSSAEYLRFRYGIQPIMSDVQAAMKAAQQVYRPVRERHFSRSKGKRESNETVFGNFVYDQVTIGYQQTRQHIAEVRCGFCDEFHKTGWDAMGINLQNVIAVPWELIGYSFVVDWFVNMGDLIYANIPRAGVTPLGGWVSYTGTSRTVTSPTTCIVNNPSAYILGSSPTDQPTYEAIRKYRYARSDTGSLVVKADFRFDNWTRCGDAIALVLQKLGRIRFDTVSN